MYSRIKLVGHPLHPMLISYPIALYSLALVAYIIYAISNSTFWFQVGVVATAGGVAMAALAALPGFLDWALGVPVRTAAKAHGLWHLVLNVTALALFILTGIINLPQWAAATPEKLWGIVLPLVAVGCTVVAGYYGWTMIQNDHVGVALSPEQARLEPEPPPAGEDMTRFPGGLPAAQ